MSLSEILQKEGTLKSLTIIAYLKKTVKTLYQMPQPLYEKSENA